MMSDWTAAGYFNPDVLTADYNSDMEALATGTTAFCFYGPSSMVDAYGINAEANLGIMPIPAKAASDEPTLIAGEDIAVGIWKDTAYPEAAQRHAGVRPVQSVLPRLPLPPATPPVSTT